MFACIYSLPSDAAAPLAVIAEQFSPRYERHRDDLVSLDLSGLERLFGDARTIGEELRRTARAHQTQVSVAVAATRTTALVLAQARPGLTVVAPGDERAALAPLPVRALATVDAGSERTRPTDPGARSGRNRPGDRGAGSSGPADSVIAVLKSWGVRTLGELAALPPADLSARLGQEGPAWQAVARGEDARPLVPTVPDERFESSLALEWPIDGLEPLSFVLTRLLEPLVVRLERRDRGAAAIATALRLVTRETCTRRLELPTPLRDVRTLRTLVLLDLESHPAEAAIDAVTITIEPTPGRILQHTLFTRPTPTPEQLSTLVARLHALMGQERVGAPAMVDSYRPGVFAMKPFATDHDQRRDRGDRRDDHDQHRDRRAHSDDNSKDAVDSMIPGGHVGQRPRAAASSAGSRLRSPSNVSSFGEARRSASGAKAAALNVVPQSLRRCRQPVPARVVVDEGRPVRVTTDRRGYAGGRVVCASGPWRVSGEWWAVTAYRRDEWDVELADGAAYRVFRDDFSDRWFVDAIFD